MANAYCERVIGTFRRECLDYLIPINQRHLRRIVREFADYYNRGRPHSALGPGLPEPNQATVPVGEHRHQLPVGLWSRADLGACRPTPRISPGEGRGVTLNNSGAQPLYRAVQVQFPGTAVSLPLAVA